MKITFMEVCNDREHITRFQHYWIRMVQMFVWKVLKRTLRLNTFVNSFHRHFHPWPMNFLQEWNWEWLWRWIENSWNRFPMQRLGMLPLIFGEIAHLVLMGWLISFSNHIGVLWADKSLMKWKVSFNPEFFRLNGIIPKFVCYLKTPNLNKITDLRPISLCLVAYKIVWKVLCVRLKRFLPMIVSDTHGAFVLGWLISDNILLAHEMVHALHPNPDCNEKFMAIKTDISKAYDRVEWDFFEDLFTRLGFDRKWIEWVMYRVISVSYSVLLNGMKYPSVQHLLFADDSLVVYRTNFTEGKEILHCLKLYGDALGQEINF